MIRYRFRHYLSRHDLAMWIAWHLPSRVRMWATVRAFADATTMPPYPAPEEVRYTDLMRAAFPNDR